MTDGTIWVHLIRPIRGLMMIEMLVNSSNRTTIRNKEQGRYCFTT